MKFVLGSVEKEIMLITSIFASVFFLDVSQKGCPYIQVVKRQAHLAKGLVGWMAVLGFNATLKARVISWRSVKHMCFLAFSHQY